MMKKLAALLLVCMMLPVSMLTAFAADEIYTVRWVMPGNEPDEMPKVIEALNQKMAAEGKNFRLEVVRIPWDAWEQRSNLMINTQEDFGLLHIMSDHASWASNRNFKKHKGGHFRDKVPAFRSDAGFPVE